MRIIVSGSMGRFPVGGNAWVHLQYLDGLRALGHEVIYLEDCGESSWVYDWERQETTSDLGFPSGYVADCLREIDLSDQWIYRAGDESCGMPLTAFRNACRRADLLLFLAVPLAEWRGEYDAPQRRAFVDLDPGFTQLEIANGSRNLVETVDRCETLFTIGQRIGTPECAVPLTGRQWLPTLPPVSLARWPYADASATHFTSLMQWRGFRDISYGGAVYGQKDREFPRFAKLPQRTSQPLLLAITGAPPDPLAEYGWDVVLGWQVSLTPGAYRQFVSSSRAALGIAKHGYVELRPGWISDRTVCYLAAGRPALVQDTGLRGLPTGEGLLTFTRPQEAIDGIEAINADYERHRRAARSLAEGFFDSTVVLPSFLEAAMN